jgi:predicted transcriptional regulator
LKTTIEIPDELFRRAKSVAAERGIPLRALVSEALSDKLNRNDKPWMKTFGALRSLHKETAKIDRIIQYEFGRIEPENWK